MAGQPAVPRRAGPGPDGGRPAPAHGSRGGLTLLGISGSLRRGSTNTALLEAARELAPGGVEVVVTTLRDIPLYDADVERESGLPAPVQRLRDAIARADGLLLASPEYNFSISGVLKNAIDWASRAPSPLDHKPTALLSGAGGSGGRRAQRHLRDILAHNAVDVIDEAVQIARARRHVEAGRLVTTEQRRAVAGVVRALADHIRHQHAAGESAAGERRPA